ncbi:hypothetical protein JTB14_034612 [Gonioctena quinquepunctata]|nr:hypothetical protein JTB14_034612 [Gonioctena quinquepunctata]
MRGENSCFSYAFLSSALRVCWTRVKPAYEPKHLRICFLFPLSLAWKWSLWQVGTIRGHYLKRLPAIFSSVGVCGECARGNKAPRGAGDIGEKGPRRIGMRFNTTLSLGSIGLSRRIRLADVEDDGPGCCSSSPCGVGIMGIRSIMTDS